MTAVKNSSDKFGNFSGSIWFSGCVGLLFGIIFWLVCKLAGALDINSLVAIPLSLIVMVVSGIIVLSILKLGNIYFIMLFMCAVFAVISQLLINLSSPLGFLFCCLVGIISCCLITVILKINRISFSVILALIIITLLYLITKC